MARNVLLAVLLFSSSLFSQIPTSSGGGGGGSSLDLDNAIISSSADASGNPNFLGTAANTVLPINGGTTPLVMYIGGVLQTLSTNVTLTLPSTVSVQQWILAKQNVSGTLVAANFLAMNTAPFYGYVAPTCPSPSPALSATNPAFWYDLSSNKSKLCTSNAGAYSASASIVIGVTNLSAVPAITEAVPEPIRLNPYYRYQQFGTGADGALVVTSGTTTIDVLKSYTSLVITGGTVTHTVNTTSYGVVVFSQNPIIITGAGTIAGTSKGRGTAAGATGTGAAGSSGANLGGSGGGGGGSGTTSAAGGAGGSKFGPMILGSGFNGGTAGAITPTAGGAGTASVSPAPRSTDYFYGCLGSSGGAGAGDGTNAGGTSGAGGGMIFVKAPAIFIASGVTIAANGGVGSNGAGGNAAGGGGGGGGCLILNAGYVSSTGATLTASGGNAGTHLGTGQDGGAGGAGIVEINKLW